MVSVRLPRPHCVVLRPRPALCRPCFPTTARMRAACSFACGRQSRAVWTATAFSFGSWPSLRSPAAASGAPLSCAGAFTPPARPTYALWLAVLFALDRRALVSHLSFPRRTAPLKDREALIQDGRVADDEDEDEGEAEDLTFTVKLVGFFLLMATVFLILLYYFYEVRARSRSCG